MQDVRIHPQALVESEALGAGTRVWAFSHIQKGVVVGTRCNIGEHCYLETGVVLGAGVKVKNGVSLWQGVMVEDDVFIGPHAIFTNVLRPRAEFKTPEENFLPTLLKRGTTIGAGATIVCGVTCQPYSFVGAGAVVTRDVASHALVLGNPARQVGWVCRCGEGLGESLICSRCPRQFHQVVGGLLPVGGDF